MSTPPNQDPHFERLLEYLLQRRGFDNAAAESEENFAWQDSSEAAHHLGRAGLMWRARRFIPRVLGRTVVRGAVLQEGGGAQVDAGARIARLRDETR